MRALLKRSDIMGGAFLVAIGAWALWLARDLPWGTLARMGSGFAPRVLAIVVIGFGIAVMARGIHHREAIMLDRAHVRPALFMGLAVFAFAMLIERTGLVLAGVVTVALAAFADRAARPREVATMALLAATVAAVLFVLALRLNIPLWPT